MPTQQLRIEEDDELRFSANSEQVHTQADMQASTASSNDMWIFSVFQNTPLHVQEKGRGGWVRKDQTGVSPLTPSQEESSRIGNLLEPFLDPKCPRDAT